MAACIPILRVLFRELRDTTPVEISGSGGGRRYYALYPNPQPHITGGTNSSDLKPEVIPHTGPSGVAEPPTPLTDLYLGENNGHRHQQ
jgi:hypothetical protein